MWNGLIVWLPRLDLFLWKEFQFDDNCVTEAINSKLSFNCFFEFLQTSVFIDQARFIF